ncbi:hypothetical protein ACIRQQ_14160 [Streptomyces fuscichromogenes]|uniref:hypothetical protein n=1 Tax=Streptomyces fuscichromogenes TaxID=1324013 RepID=UPI0038145C43
MDRVGFGDDVAAAGGLLAFDGDRAPVFYGDAITDPLAGLVAAALAMSEPASGRGVLWKVATAEVVAATVHGHTTPTAPVTLSGDGDGDGWQVDTGEDLVPVAAPMARRPAGAVFDASDGMASVRRVSALPSTSCVATDAAVLEVAGCTQLPAVAHGEGFGLVGLQERVSALGGRLGAGPRDGVGWQVRTVFLVRRS